MIELVYHCYVLLPTCLQVQTIVMTNLLHIIFDEFGI